MTKGSGLVEEKPGFGIKNHLLYTCNSDSLGSLSLPAGREVSCLASQGVTENPIQDTQWRQWNVPLLLFPCQAMRAMVRSLRCWEPLRDDGCNQARTALRALPHFSCCWCAHRHWEPQFLTKGSSSVTPQVSGVTPTENFALQPWL